MRLSPRNIRRTLRSRAHDQLTPAPFVTGIARSGTTLLRLMLDAHPQLAIPPETHFATKVINAFHLMREDDVSRAEMRARGAAIIVGHPRWGDFGLDAHEFQRRVDTTSGVTARPILRTFYEYYAETQDKPRWGDKSPPYTWKAPKIQAALPEARFINLIRDGRDVAMSLNEVSWGPAGFAESADKWVKELTLARSRARRLRNVTYLEVRYEDLVNDPEPVLRQVADLISLPWSDSMMTYHEGAEKRMAQVVRELKPQGGGLITAEERVRQHELVSKPPSSQRAGRWRTEMSDEDRQAFEEIAGDLLRDLGYET
ncbi:sulfotransferase [soil metagenome]